MNSTQTRPLCLTDSLEKLPLDGLKRIAEMLGVETTPASKARLITDIPAALEAGIPDDLAERLSQYPKDDLIVMLALDECRSFLGDEQIEKALSDYNIVAKKAHPLLVDGGGGNYRLFVEFVPTARRLCADAIALGSSAEPKTVITLSPETLFGDIYSVWAALMKRPLQPTKTRGLKKRDIEKLSRLLLVDEDEPNQFRIASYFEISRLEFILGFLQRNRAIRTNAGVFEANPTFAELSDPYFADTGRVVAEQLVGDGGTIATALVVYALQGNTGWIGAKRLIALTRGFLPATGGDYANMALYALFVTGYISIGMSRGGLLVRAARDFESLRPDELWDDAPEFLLGGNFEVKVPANTMPTIRLKLETFADLVKPDVYYDYEITRDSVYRALDDGIAAEEIVAFLGEYSKHPIPQNVEFGFNNWERQFRQVGFEDGVFLFTEDEAVANELANLEEVAETRGEVLDVFAIRINRNRYEYVRSYLREKGYLPRSLPNARRYESETGGVSTLFSGYDGGRDGIKADAIDRDKLLIQTLDFARKTGKNVTLKLRGGQTITGRVVSVAPGKSDGEAR
ncbi:MAG: hypothetical protein GY771_10400, partial [bacterium]|nr:hypothetical protein [bacterium]